MPLNDKSKLKVLNRITYFKMLNFEMLNFYKML